MTQLVNTIKRLRLSTNQRGDTIVEVLVCIAIISLVLAGAFVTTRDSQLGVQDSQEHGEALKLIESQIEQLRYDAANGDANVFSSGPYCYYQGSLVSTSGPTAADCVQDSSGNKATAQPEFNLSVTGTPSDGGYLFTITSTWADINGNGNGQESMLYRLYQD
jgi:prepilin-type N-terminal cleavage/methylation domain-containing protein